MLVTSLILSTVGLKSIEAIVPEIAGEKAVVPTALAAPEAVFTM